MANPSPIIILILVLATMSMLAEPRPLTNTTTTTTTTGALSLEARLKVEGGDGGSTGCWDTLFELQACTGEIILFFINGETYLGTGCCRAIVKIEKKCWPSLMGSLGFTTQESDILRGYCDVSDDGGDVPSAMPPPPPPPSPSPPPPPPPPPQSANVTTSSNSTGSNHGLF